MFQFFLAVYSARRTGSYYIKMLFLVINPRNGGCSWHFPSNLLFSLVNSYLIAYTDSLYFSPVGSICSLTLGSSQASFHVFFFFLPPNFIHGIRDNSGWNNSGQARLGSLFLGSKLSGFAHAAQALDLRTWFCLEMPLKNAVRMVFQSKKTVTGAQLFILLWKLLECQY